MIFHIFSFIMLLFLTNCGGISHKKIQHMTAEELAITRPELRNNKETSMLIKNLERSLNMATDPNELEHIMIELADLYLQDKQYEKAQIFYTQYKQFYPNGKHVERACYENVKICALIRYSPERDQTLTKEAISCAQDYLERFPENPEYTNAVKKMLDDCYISLIASEEHRIKFYLHKYYTTGTESSLDSVQKRIEFAEKELLPYLEKEPESFKQLKQTYKQYRNIEQSTSTKHPRDIF